MSRARLRMRGKVRALVVVAGACACIYGALASINACVETRMHYEGP